jgi:hypothetical protein
MDIGLNYAVVPPSTLQEWLDCFDYMKTNKIDQDFLDQIENGSFEYDEKIKEHFQGHLVDTVNFLLEKYAKRFSRELNYSLELNDFADTYTLFLIFKRDISNCLFFNNLEFLRDEVRQELHQDIKNKMTDYWQDVILFLHQQTAEVNNDDLEDAIYLIKRIKLFPQ